MESSKKSFILYHNQYDFISKLTVAERGELITAIFDYQINDTVATNLSPAAEVAFCVIKTQFERDNKKYQKICERNRKNGEKGGRPKKANLENPNNPKNPMGFEVENVDVSRDLNVFDNDNSKTQKTQKTRYMINDKGYMINDKGYMINELISSSEAINITPPKSPSKSGTSCSPKANDESKKRFDLFWKEYPRKQAKQTALKSWLKLKPDEALTERIIAAVKLQRQSREWKKDDGEYIPHAATWLNQSRWEDEPTAAQRSSIDTRRNDYDFLFDTSGD